MNGAAEGVNRTLMETARAFLEDSHLPPELWAELVHSAASIEGIPQSLWRERSARHLKRIRSLSFVHIPKQRRNKLQPKAILVILVRYAVQTRGYRIFFPKQRKVVETKHVSFDENQLGMVVLGSVPKGQTITIGDITDSNDSHSEPTAADEAENIQDVVAQPLDNGEIERPAPIQQRSRITKRLEKGHSHQKNGSDCGSNRHLLLFPKRPKNSVEKGNGALQRC